MVNSEGHIQTYFEISSLRQNYDTIGNVVFSDKCFGDFYQIKYSQLLIPSTLPPMVTILPFLTQPKSLWPYSICQIDGYAFTYPSAETSVQKITWAHSGQNPLSNQVLALYYDKTTSHQL